MTLCAATLSDFDCHKTFCREARPNFSLFLSRSQSAKKASNKLANAPKRPKQGVRFAQDPVKNPAAAPIVVPTAERPPAPSVVFSHDQVKLLKCFPTAAVGRHNTRCCPFLYMYIYSENGPVRCRLFTLRLSRDLPETPAAILIAVVRPGRCKNISSAVPGYDHFEDPTQIINAKGVALVLIGTVLDTVNARRFDAASKNGELQKMVSLRSLSPIKYRGFVHQFRASRPARFCYDRLWTWFQISEISRMLGLYATADTPTGDTKFAAEQLLTYLNNAQTPVDVKVSHAWNQHA